MKSKRPEDRSTSRRLSGASIKDVFGVAKREDLPPVSIDEINEAIRKGWAGEP